MSYRPACSGFNDPEVAEIARFGLTSLRASAAIFYWVDGPYSMVDVEVEGLNPQFFTQYASQMIKLDPQHVSKMAAGQQKVSRLVSTTRTHTTETRLYNDFLGNHGIVDVVDLLFWNDGSPVAGLGVMKRRSDPPVCDASIDTAIALQRFVEHNLRHHNRVSRQRLRGMLTRDYRLTSRETDVAELAAQGSTNAEIATRLHIGVPTVKTHLLHALGKTGCANRTHLAAKMGQTSR